MTSPVVQNEHGAEPGQGGRFRHPWLIATLVGIGFGPLLYWHFASMLARPHYQFLLLLPVALWLLVSSSPREKRADVTLPVTLTSAGLLLVALGGLGFASWAWSPWIAAVSGMIAALGLMLQLGGRHRAANWLPIWGFSWLVVPLPFGLDEDLIVRLRTVTTRMTSSVLDELGILHQSYANVIELPGKPLFVADACSGIHSLYVLIAMALFLSMYQRRSLLHTTSMLASTFGLVLVENVTRIATVAAALGWQHDLSFGFNHTLLGIVLFCASALLIFTTDQLLLFLLPEHPMHQLIMIFRPDRPLVEKKTALPAVRPSGPFAMFAWTGIALCFPALGLAQLTRLPSSVPSFAIMFPPDLQLPKLGEDALPQELAGFNRDGYETVDRVDGDPFGKSSQRWTYKKGSLTVGISLDYPYEGIKDLCECYSQIGWQISDRQILNPETLAKSFRIADADAPIAQGLLFRDLFGDGLLLFSSFDLTGKTDALIKDVARGVVDQRAANRLLMFGREQETLAAANSANPPYVQIHLLARSFDKFSPDIQQELLAMFVEVRKILTPLVVNATGKTSVAVTQEGDE